jgi:hypothetical protein
MTQALRYVDTSFSGNWELAVATTWDSDTARLCSGYFIMFADCLVTWSSKLQTEIALLTTEREYLAISVATREPGVANDDGTSTP